MVLSGQTASLVQVAGASGLIAKRKWRPAGSASPANIAGPHRRQGPCSVASRLHSALSEQPENDVAAPNKSRKSILAADLFALILR